MKKEGKLILIRAISNNADSRGGTLGSFIDYDLGVLGKHRASEPNSFIHKIRGEIRLL